MQSYLEIPGQLYRVFEPVKVHEGSMSGPSCHYRILVGELGQQTDLDGTPMDLPPHSGLILVRNLPFKDRRKRKSFAPFASIGFIDRKFDQTLFLEDLLLHTDPDNAPGLLFGVTTKLWPDYSRWCMGKGYWHKEYVEIIGGNFSLNLREERQIMAFSHVLHRRASDLLVRAEAEGTPHGRWESSFAPGKFLKQPKPEGAGE